MNRTVKYRAWCKKEKEYRTVTDLLFNELTGKLCYICTVNARTGNYPRLSRPEDVILEQYTGINDIDGDEICVGDIVKVTPLEIWIDHTEKLPSYVASVSFYNGAFVVTDEEDPRLSELLGRYNYEELLSGQESGLEILGNINENPELLKTINEED